MGLVHQPSDSFACALADRVLCSQPPKLIDDPSDSKPLDWVDEATIQDPAAVKPDDWDESAPRMIPDPSASKPEDWQEDTPQFIQDPDVKKPDGKPAPSSIHSQPYDMECTVLRSTVASPLRVQTGMKRRTASLKHP